MPLVLVEDFRPFHESIEWRVAAAYWDTQGFDAFFSGQVPHLATNDGARASRAANVLFESCRVAESSDPEARVEAMMQLSDAFRVERSYLAVDGSDLPFVHSAKSLAAEHAEATGRELATVVLPWSAGSSLLKSVGMLIDGGFVLFSDYGYVDPEMGTATYERYGDSRSMALNLELLERIVVAEAAVPLAYVAPPGDAGTGLHVRMVCRPTDTELQECFYERFDGATFHGLAGDLDEAEAARRSGDYERAAAVYEGILARFPETWCVVLGLAETALAAGDLAAAVTFAEKAVEMNPVGSLAVHEVLGDALAGSGRLAEAEVVYRRVLAMAPSARASSGLAWVLSQRGATFPMPSPRLREVWTAIASASAVRPFRKRCGGCSRSVPPGRRVDRQSGGCLGPTTASHFAGAHGAPYV